ncbi:MAG TPA: ABC transporter permease [Oscillospiraceae bacterium]|nr:ABC transporter permease [Oscillospiraceae bacterium]
MRLLNNSSLFFGFTLITGLVMIAILAPLLATHSPYQTDVDNWLQAPSQQHLFGTDRLGRDIFSRVLYGARISLTVGLLATFLSVGIGTLLGLMASFYGGLIDMLIMRFADIVLVFPSLLLVLTLVAIFEPAIWLVILVIGCTGWPSVARLVRGEVLRLRQSDFVASARLLGATNRRIILQHLLPNALGPVLVAATLCVPAAVMTEAGLSYLGLGVQLPMPTWGNMLRDAQAYLRYAWWYAFFPGLFIFLTVFSFHLAGEGLRQALGIDRSTRRNKSA